MKKLLLILTILLSMCLVALLIFSFYLSVEANAPQSPSAPETTVPGTASTAPDSTSPEEDSQAGGNSPAPSTLPATIPEADPQPTDATETTQPADPSDSTDPTGEPELDENETPIKRF